MGQLTDLLAHYGSDKVSLHSYGPTYEKLFPPDKREEVTAVLELGIGVPGSSLWAWRDYFPNAKVVGFDRGDWFFGVDRIWTIRGDMDAPAGLFSVLLRTTTQFGIAFDLIVDDCSHKPHHQIAFLALLRQFLAPGGVYVVEDVTAIEHANAIKSVVPEVEVVDLRKEKNRHDDIMVLWRKPK